jgi:hypothetical protein
MSVLHQTSRPIRVAVNAHYYSLGDSYFHCGERLDALYCVKCDDEMGCYYCEHNYNEAHDCDDLLSGDDDILGMSEPFERFNSAIDRMFNR